VKFIIFPPGLINYPTTTHPWEATATFDDVMEIVLASERLSYDYVTMPDHIVIDHHAAELLGSRWPDPITALAYFAGATTSIGLYTSVLVIPYSNLFVQAKALATLDWMSKGRLALAIGLGHLESEYQALGVDFAKRGAIANEYIEALRILWTSDEPRYEGEHVSFDDIVLDPKPVSDPCPPIYIGGNSKPAMRRAARLGDGWHPWTVQPGDLPGCLEYIRSQPDYGAPDRPFEVIMPLSRLNVDDVTHEELGDTYVPGTEDEIVEDIETLIAAGTTGLLTYFPPTSSKEEYLERITWFAETIIPRYRS